MKHRAGYHKTNLYGELAYSSFVPAPLPPVPPIELTADLVALLTQAHGKLATLERMTKLIPDVTLFVSMYVRKEALLSSQIEGTQATLEDVLDPSVDANTNRDVAEVINYIKATEFAIERLRDLPLCNRLIRETHAVLMSGVRGQERTPGEFRRSQNWIGGQGSTLRSALFVPPAPEDMEVAIADLERYLNTPTDDVLQAALTHYQFETIHPFLDGNGRVGRLLIVLFLMQHRVLTTPALYLSYYLKKHRIEYYDRMMEVRKQGHYEQWVKFFLRALIESATEAMETIEELDALHREKLEAIESLPRSPKMTLSLFRYLEANPIIEIGKTALALGVSYNTIASAVRSLVDAGVLVQTSSARRNRAFAYEAYLAILRRGT
ncbi:MAG: Fic family protein [Bacillota bacterium]|nr:Fic family protein [Bacillota bacterium]